MGNMVAIKKQKDDDMGLAREVNEPEYPYGTSIEIRDDLFEQLDLSSYKVGDEVTVIAKAVIKRTSENSYKENGEATETHKSADIQLTELSVSAPVKGDRADKMYGGE